MTELPKELIEEGKSLELKRTVNQLIRYLQQYEVPDATALEETPRGHWSNTPPVVDDIAVGTVRELPGTSLVDVWDSQGWVRMQRSYFEEHYSQDDIQPL